MKRLLAWLGLCGACTALSVFWWPFGLLPAAVLLVAGTWGLVKRNGVLRARRRAVIERAETDWRALVAWLAMGAAVSVALYFVGSKVIERTVTRNRGLPCVDASRAPGLQPSKGCERLAELLVRTCRVRLVNCRVSRARPLAPRERQALDALVAQLARQRAARRAAERLRRERLRRRGAGLSPGERGAAPAPGRGGSGDASPAPGGGGEGTGGGSPPAPGRPTPTGAVNRAKDRLRDSANDATDSVGAGRPVPPLPDVPPAPVCLPIVGCP